METLQDKTAIVLGASSAYGAATARMLGREGAAVVLGGRSRDKLEALEEEIVSSGGRAVSLGVHLAKRHHLEHLVEAAVETFGGPDILVFAARAFSPPLKSLDVEAFERSVDVNVKGLLYTLTAVLPAMQETGGGHVVYLGPEQPEDEDPLYEAGLAAADVLLRESCRAFGSGGGYELASCLSRQIWRPSSAPRPSAAHCSPRMRRPQGSRPTGFEHLSPW